MATMPDVRPDLSPISDAVTNGIRVEVLSRHSPENSQPQQEQWVFTYTIRITNQGTDTVQLISRHWLISDMFEHTEDIQGPGVVGQQPVLKPGESFQYTSWCRLKTPTGVMQGTYRMSGSGGQEFDIEIAPFALKARYTVH